MHEALASIGEETPTDSMLAELIWKVGMLVATSLPTCRVAVTSQLL